MQIYCCNNEDKDVRDASQLEGELKVEEYPFFLSDDII